MQRWIDLAMGPLFGVAMVFMVGGLLRHVGVTIWEAGRAYRRAGDRRLPVGQVAKETVRWLLPVDRVAQRWYYSLVTVPFHVGVILVPVFLAGHIELWRKGLGLSWPAIPNGPATVLTWAVIATGLGVVVFRVVFRDSRALSVFHDYALPLLIAFVFASGFLVMHPQWNPFPRDPTLLVHALSADGLLLAVPFTKLSHMILLPFTQIVGELAWHFPPDAGARVARALGKESEPI